VDAIQLIRNDHRAIEGLFRSFERAARRGDGRRQRDLARELVRQLSVHAGIEEQFLYPALREAGAEEDVLRALEEHHAAKLILEEIDALSPRSERFVPKVRLLGESVLRHVQEEERQQLPRLRRALDARQRAELGATLDRAKGAAPTRPHPSAPDTPPGTFVAAALAAVLDRLRDALRAAVATLRMLAERAARRAAAAARSMAGEVRERGRAAVERTAEGARTTARRAASAAREAADGAAERRREARVRARGAGPAGAERVRRAARRASGAVKKGARAAARGYSGEPHPTVH
jgi:hemerythrin superfamily protein